MFRGKTRRTVVTGLAVVVLIVAAVVVPLASGSSDGIRGLDADIQGGIVGGRAVRTGQSGQFLTTLLNHSQHPVLIESARQYGLAGHRMPTIESFRLTGGMRNFRGSQVRDYVVPPGAQAEINYNVVGHSPGDYVSLGLDLRVRQAGKTETIRSQGGMQVLCSDKAPGPHEQTSCIRIARRLGRENPQ
jgi:hypothetical protein